MSTVQKQNDVPLSFAVAALLVVLCGYLYLNFLRFRPQATTALLELVEEYPHLVWLSFSALVLNLTLLSTYLKRTVGLERQGSKLEALSGKKRSLRVEPTTLMSVIGAALIFLTIERKVAPSSCIFITQLISRESQVWVVRLTALNCALAGFFLIQRVVSLMAKLNPNSAILSQSDEATLFPKGKGTHQTLVRIVSKNTSVSRDVIFAMESQEPAQTTNH